MHFAEFSNLV